MLYRDRVYVAFQTGRDGKVYPVVRVTPEPPWFLEGQNTFAAAQRYVYSIWPDATRVEYRTITGRVSPLCRPPCSLRGKL